MKKFILLIALSGLAMANTCSYNANKAADYMETAIATSNDREFRNAQLKTARDFTRKAIDTCPSIYREVLQRELNNINSYIGRY